MQHLQAHKDHYRYRTGTTGEIVEVEVRYELGGMNYFQGCRSPRGIYVSISPLKLESTTLPDGHVLTTTSMMCFSGIKALVRPLPRKNPKALREVAELLDALAPQAAAAFSESTKRLALDILRAPFATPEASTV